jgi:hypothetical protein
MIEQIELGAKYRNKHNETVEIIQHDLQNARLPFVGRVFRKGVKIIEFFSPTGHYYPDMTNLKSNNDLVEKI